MQNLDPAPYIATMCEWEVVLALELHCYSAGIQPPSTIATRALMQVKLCPVFEGTPVEKCCFNKYILY